MGRMTVWQNKSIRDGSTDAFLMQQQKKGGGGNLFTLGEWNTMVKNVYRLPIYGSVQRLQL